MALAFATLPLAAMAQSACTLPVQPFCSTGVMGPDKTSGALRCESDIEKYIQDLEAYRGCLDAARERAGERIEQAGRFRECLKDGREDCAFNSRQ
ncbi:hypothetical protein [Desertibaculum subflavum]|uniref:hypothetical protein n=1 Tax=Desertibaculum subflavum TaxID=2268458 RepID=UPI0013C53357